jgi:cell division protein FtsB
MGASAAERQRDYRRRQAAARDELEVLRARVPALEADVERLSAELEDALASRSAGRCAVHGTELACPRCYREGSWE